MVCGLRLATGGAAAAAMGSLLLVADLQFIRLLYFAAINDADTPKMQTMAGTVLIRRYLGVTVNSIQHLMV